MSNLTWNKLTPIDYEQGDDKEIHNPSDTRYLDFYSEHIDKDAILYTEDDFWKQINKYLVVDISNVKYTDSNHIDESTLFLNAITILKTTIINENNSLYRYELYDIKYHDKLYDNVRISNVRMPYKVDYYNYCANYIKQHGKVLFKSNYNQMNPLSIGYYFGWRLFSNGFTYGDNCFNFQKYGLHAKYSYIYDNINYQLDEYFTIEEAKDSNKMRAGPNILEMKQIIANCINI